MVTAGAIAVGHILRRCKNDGAIAEIPVIRYGWDCGGWGIGRRKVDERSCLWFRRVIIKRGLGHLGAYADGFRKIRAAIGVLCRKLDIIVSRR